VPPKVATIPPPPRPRPIPQERPRPPNSFPAPMNFSFGAPQRSPAPPGRAPSEYGPGPVAQGAQNFAAFATLRQGKVASDWMNDLHLWWLRHGYYPQQAAMNGEDGTVTIEIIVDRYGRVHTVDLLGRSGSQWLDLGAQSVFRGANLPPFPPDTHDDQITLDLRINYILVRR
jgi:periplasmic protein TonB